MVSESIDLLKMIVTWSLAWLNRQQATTVILLAILSALLYIAYVYIPAAFDVFKSEQTANREHITRELKNLRDDDREQRSLDRKTYEATLMRVLDLADHKGKTSMLLKRDDISEGASQ